MTDSDVIRRVLSCIDPQSSAMHLVRRNGRILLAIPDHREGALRTLRLYQPQRPAARLLAAGLRLSIHSGIHTLFPVDSATVLQVKRTEPPMPGIESGSCGILLGSPEHRVRRAIATSLTDNGWEVAKVAFGSDGSAQLVREALTLTRLSAIDNSVPGCLGLHHAEDLTLLRMPFLGGTPVKAGSSDKALALLNRWITDCPAIRIEEYSEWESIQSALGNNVPGNRALDSLAGKVLKPVIRHGDFARWNLLEKPDGDLVVIDWEWGHESGVPGLDLVHYFLQDARLVRRAPDIPAIESVRRELRNRDCSSYLNATGWTGDPILPIIACLAFKQGAGHQQNRTILDAAVSMLA